MRISFTVSLCVLISCFGCGQINAVTNGVIYKNYRPNSTTRIHVLTINPNKVKIIAARAQDMGQGLSFVSDYAQYYKAIAAINGGFFRINHTSSNVGLPAGVLKVNKNWYGIGYSPRGAIGWDPASNTVLMDILQTKSKLLINDRLMPINAMNKTATANKAYLISDSFLEPIIFEHNIGIIFANGRVNQVLTKGHFTLPRGAYAYNVGSGLQSFGENIKTGDPVKLDISALPQVYPDSIKQWNKLPYIVGGGPLLITDQKLIKDFKREKLRQDFIYDKHARTAIGILPNSDWVFVVVEQDVLQEIPGMTIAELQKFMQSLGCVQAVNLDGGGSSAMFVQANVIGGASNFHVSAGRPVADAVLVVAR